MFTNLTDLEQWFILWGISGALAILTTILYIVFEVIPRRVRSDMEDPLHDHRYQRLAVNRTRD